MTAPIANRLALVDCNNFYVSCEQVFNPTLRGKPVVVLSNNDGCVVSRSAEAKAAGVPMAVPYFKIRQSFEALGGIALSSNYALYADMSHRAMTLMRDMAESQEIYSIDEAFVDQKRELPGQPEIIGAVNEASEEFEAVGVPRYVSLPGRVTTRQER